MRTAAAYLLVVVLSVELALAECFLTGARPWGHPLPVAALLAAVANPFLGYAGGRVLRGRLPSLGASVGAVAPGVIWLTTVTVLGAQRAEGDVLVPATLRGYALIGVGAVGAVIGAVLGATPRGQTSR